MTDTRSETTGRILVAEDVEVISHVMTQLLIRAGYDVELARDGEECLEKVVTFQPELILLDLMMPKLHGIEVLKRLRADEATKDIGVIVCTAKSFKNAFC